MPDNVGVLQLSIEDNSRQAGDGLKYLEGALSSIKSTLSGGLNLPTQSIKNFASAIAANSKTLSGTGTFLNAVKEYQKVFKDAGKVKIDTTPITELKTALEGGIKIGQAGTQLNKLREAFTGDWGQVGDAGKEIHSAVSGMQAIKDMGDAFQHGNTAGNIKAVAEALNELTRAQKDLPSGGAHDLYGMLGGASANRSGGMLKMLGRPFSLQTLGGRGTTNSPGQMSMFEQVTGGLQETISKYKEWQEITQKTNWPAFGSALYDNIKGIMDTPLEHLHDIYRTPTKSMEDYKNATDAVLPKVQKMSSEEMILAANAKKAKTEISSLIDSLDSFKSPSGTALRGIIDVVTGVSRGKSSGMINASTTMFTPIEATTESISHIETATEGVIKIFDSASGSYKEMYVNCTDVAEGADRASESINRATESMSNYISLVDIPTSGQNGMFANAADELKYLDSELAKSKENLAFWENEYVRIQKLIKYNGSTPDRMRMLGQAEEGFGTAYGDIERHTEAINKLLEYSKEYAATARETARANREQAESAAEAAAAVTAQNEATEASIRAAHAGVNSMAIQNIMDTLNNTPNVRFVDIVNDLNGVDRTARSAEESMSAFLREMQGSDAYAKHIRNLNPELAEVSRHFTDAAEAAKHYADETKNAGKKSVSLGTILKTLFPTLTNLAKRFKSMLVMRSIRYLVRQLAAGVSEGIQNVYQYSKAIGSSFAPAMDSAASALQQMKNSIGAALAPAIQALIPVLQTVVNWFINLLNYVNQFFALLNGQASWTRALPATVGAFDKQTKAAKSAGAAMKDLLADWDELNIIQSQTGGGGGAGSATAAEDYLKMFEEVSVFDNKVKDIVKFVQDNFKEILASALGIKAAMMAWRFSNAVAEWLPVLSTIATGFAAGATIGLSIMLTDLAGKMYIKDGSPAWLIADALSGAVGATLAGKLAGKIAGATAGQVVTGFTLVLNGIVNIKNAIGAAAQQQRGKSFMLNALGAIETGIGAGLLAATAGACTAASIATGLVTGVIALTIGVVLSLEAQKDAEYRQMAIDAFAAEGKDGLDPDAYLDALQKEMDKRTADSELVINTSITLGDKTKTLNDTLESIRVLNETIKGKEKLSEEDANSFKAAWDIVLETMRDISKMDYSTMYAGLDEMIKNGSEEIRKAALEYKKESLQMEAIMNGAQAAFEKELNMLEDQIIAGSTDPEVLDRYMELYEMLAEETTTGMDDFRKALSEGMRFDFGSEDPIGNAVNFIKSMGQDTVQPALDAAKAQYDAELEAINRKQEQLNKWREKGFIKDNEYNKLDQHYKKMIELYASRYEEQQKQINDTVNEAYGSILSQAVEGYYQMDQDDDRALKSYVDSVFNPLVKAIEEAGGEIPDEVRAIIARGGENAINAAAGDIMRDAGRKGMYESIFEDFMHDQLDYPVTFAIDYELELVGHDPSKIGEDTAKDIINSMYDVFDDPYTILTSLNEVFGWSYEDIVNALDLSSLDNTQLEELLSTVEALRKEKEELLLANYNSTPGSAGYIDWYEYQEETEKVSTAFDNMKKKIQDALNGKQINNEEIAKKTKDAAGAFEDMASRIKAALNSLNGIGFNFSSSGMNGMVRTLINPLHAATGAIVKSGDLVMANENGNFEMMGRMGNQPVIANNQQIVAGISQGVATANGGVESRLNNIENLLTRVLNKEFIAKAVPSSGWGAHSVTSSEQYSKVTG